MSIIYLLLDTGMRASELCALTLADVNRSSGDLRVLGKGNKWRTVHMALSARRALWRYLEAHRRGAEVGEPLFTGFRGHTPGAPLTKFGLSQLIRKAGERAGIEGVRCSPHTFRHTFAINFLRNGGDLFQLQALLGHEDIAIVRRYVQYAEQDLANAHRKASPADRMRLK